jgi:hypothetical protein
MDRSDYLNDDDDFEGAVEAERRKLSARGQSALSPSATASKARASVELLSSAAIVPTAICWLWRDWLAQGRLQLLAGAPGAGKTTIALSLAATVSTGERWPDESHAPIGNVVIWSGEDDAADTLVPRLEAAGADRTRVFLVGGTQEGRASRSFDPARDMQALGGAIKSVGDVRLVIIDPVALVAVHDSHKNAETRRDLQPLVDLCRETGGGCAWYSSLRQEQLGPRAARAPHRVDRVLCDGANRDGRRQDDS